MQIIFTGEEMPRSFNKSIFLAGPSLRPGQEKEMTSWRDDAIKILQDIGFDGVVFVPENRDGKFDKDFSYDNQIEWEEKYLNVADCIVFWIPRDLSLDSKGNIKLPAFTTNIEFGFYADSGKVVVGAPEDAEKIAYIKHYAEEYKVPFSDTLTETLRSAMDRLKEGAERSGGERYVPLFIWKLDSFQDWYQAQKETGNTLEDARLLYTFRPGFKDFVFLWALKVKIYVASEDRFKENEVVISRPDISSVCLWYDTDGSNGILDNKIIIIKEFRSPANTKDGFIRELASGSSPSLNEKPEEIAAEEVLEETGLNLDIRKLIALGGRQLCGTFSSHKSYLFSYQLSDEELAWLEAQDGIVHGKAEDTERTFIEIFSVEDVLNNNLIDWSNLGMIFSVMFK